LETPIPHIIVTAPFKFAHFGYQVEEFEPGADVRETTDECAAIAIENGWATPAVEKDDAKAAPAAPENKDAAPQRSTKAAA